MRPPRFARTVRVRVVGHRSRRVELGARVQVCRVLGGGRCLDFRADLLWITVAFNGAVRFSTIPEGWSFDMRRLRTVRSRRLGAELVIVVRAPFPVTVALESLKSRRRT